MARRLWPVVRAALTVLNGTTGAGLLIALAGGAKVHRGREAVFVAEGYRRKIPGASCFTVGSVVLTRRSAEWLLHADRGELFGHEARHTSQYALLGPLFWPSYWLACGWSYARTGSYATANAFERHAGLAAGGYLRASAAIAPTHPSGGSPSRR